MLRQMWAGVKYNRIKWNLNSLWKAFQPQRLMTGSRRQDLVEGDDDLQRDQRYDNEFETQGSLRVDDIGERRCGLGDHRKFSRRLPQGFSAITARFLSDYRKFSVKRVNAPL